MSIKINIPITDEWSHMFRVTRPFRRRYGNDDFVIYSEPYAKECGEPVWFYSWGNTRWLRCPMGRPGDRVNAAGDRIEAVDVRLKRGKWTFVVIVESR